jgi:hypothetical protein
VATAKLYELRLYSQTVCPSRIVTTASHIVVFRDALIAIRTYIFNTEPEMTYGL